ncbi:MAG: hypothetical protein ABR500_09150 [Dermatophilaceae bacterium]
MPDHSTPVSPPVAALAQVADWPELNEPIEMVRDALTSLRWHQALRRRIPECAAESRVRGAQASGELEGARLPVDMVRELMAGVRPWPQQVDPVESVMRGVVAATAASEEVRSRVLGAPAQALARLHVAAVGDRVDAAAVGRPRATGEPCGELVDIGPLPGAAEVSDRLDLLGEVIRGHASIPGVILAAVAHAEVATVRPFTHGNGVVARALERSLIQATGLDPTGVAVTEIGHFRQGMPAYVGALTAYATGSREGVRLWLVHSCDALVAAAAEGRAVADAVLAGRLPQA